MAEPRSATRRQMTTVQPVGLVGRRDAWPPACPLQPACGRPRNLWALTRRRCNSHAGGGVRGWRDRDGAQPPGRVERCRATVEEDRMKESDRGLSPLAAGAIAAGTVIGAVLLGGRTSPTPDHPRIRRWYRNLDKPGFTPPPPAYAIAWTGIQAGLAYGGYRLLRRPASPRRALALALGGHRPGAWHDRNRKDGRYHPRSPVQDTTRDSAHGSRP